LATGLGVRDRERFSQVDLAGVTASFSSSYGVELDHVQHGVVLDGTSMSRPVPQRFEVPFSGASDVRARDRSERHEVDVIDLDGAVPDVVPVADLHHRSLPQAERDGDPAAQDVVAELLAELHGDDRKVWPTRVLVVRPVRSTSWQRVPSARCV
jgi:hypothetical protein